MMFIFKNIVYIDIDPSLLFWLACISVHFFCVCFSVSVDSNGPHSGIFAHTLLVFSHYLSTFLLILIHAPSVVSPPQLCHTCSTVQPLSVSPLSPSQAPLLLSHTCIDKNENLGPHIREKRVASFLLNLGCLTYHFQIYPVSWKWHHLTSLDGSVEFCWVYVSHFLRMDI